MTDFKTVFEEAAPQLIAAAWDYLDRSPAVETVWVYVSRDEGVYTYNAYYRVGGAVLDHYDAANRVGADASFEAQDWLSERLGAHIPAFRDAAKTSEVPTRMVLRFRTADSDFVADFYYDSLWPGVPADRQPALADVEEQWFARLKATGNDSAAL